VLALPGPDVDWEGHLDDLAADLDQPGGVALWSYLYGGEEWLLAKIGQISEQEYWRRLLVPFGMTDLETRRGWVRRLFELIGGVHPRMRELLIRLQGRYRLALLSNASDWLKTALEEEFQLQELFDVVVISAVEGLAKPDPAVFQLTLDRLDVAPSEALFIDDQARNTRAAEALGIPSIVFPGVDGLWGLFATRGIL
jgi:putative hydrolase of the HAD superfamily